MFRSQETARFRNDWGTAVTSEKSQKLLGFFLKPKIFCISCFHAGYAKKGACLARILERTHLTADVIFLISVMFRLFYGRIALRFVRLDAPISRSLRTSSFLEIGTAVSQPFRNLVSTTPVTSSVHPLQLLKIPQSSFQLLHNLPIIIFNHPIPCL